jgi:alkylhydroperoxidase family enzyme
VFDPKEEIALIFAAEITNDSNAITEEVFERLREQFDEGEIVEIAAVAGLFAYFNRFNNALCVPPTR